MSDKTNPILGIDFGTSYSRIARWDGIRAVPCPLRDGRLLMKSAAYFDLGLGKVLIGDHALARGRISPERVVQNIKRRLGEAGRTLSLGGKLLTPTEVVTDILATLMSDLWASYPCGVCQPAGAVITHPYCFKYPQIAALRQAAKKAEIKVLRLIPDTVALALISDSWIGIAKSENVIVLDLGGGTLDVTVLHIVFDSTSVTVEVIATGGDDQLGGMDFDEALVSLIIDRCAYQEGVNLRELDEPVKLQTMARLREKATQAKVGFSHTARCLVEVEHVVPGRHFNIELSRAEFEAACAVHLQKIRQIIADTIKRSGLSKQDIGKVVTTGGASRMPAVAKIVADVTGMEPYPVDPDCSVACGAAVLAAAEVSRFEGGKIVVHLVTPHALGLRLDDDEFSPMIPECNRIPCEVTTDLLANRQGATLPIEVFQGTCDENMKIGAVTITESPKNPGPFRFTLAVDAQQMVYFRVGTDAGITQEGMLPALGSSLSGAPEEARRPFCQEAQELVKELERATDMLPSPMAGVAARVTRRARVGEPPDGSDATDLVREWFWFAVDCLLADYAMGERHDISIMQLLTKRTKDDPGAIRVALADRLIALAKEGHVAAEASVLVEWTEALLGEVRNVHDKTHLSAAARVAPRQELDGKECRRLTELTRTALRAIDGFVLYAGYGDSIYRFQGTTPTKASAPDAPSIRHGQCELATREADQELVLDSLWEVCEGPTLRRRESADDLPSLRAWTVERTQIVLVGAPLQALIVDAMMVTNDSHLDMTTITAASVAQVAGEEFRRHARGKHVEFGDVVATPAGALSAKVVCHACTMDWKRRLQGDDLFALLGKVLRLAATSGYSSVALPLVGVNYGIEATDIAAHYVRAIQEHAQSNPMPSLIVLSIPQGDDPVVKLIVNALEAHEERAAFASRKARVFISARKADYKYAAQVYQFLKSRGVSTFFSEESLPQLGSSDYRREIDRALDCAEHMVVVTSSLENVQSPWVEAEWGLFINEKRSGRKSGNIVTLAVGSLKPSDLPPSLRYYEVMTFDPEQFPRLCQYVAE